MLESDPLQSEDPLPSQEATAIAPLVAGTLTGDNVAFERLVAMYHEEIFRMAYYRTRSRMDAEDLTQDVFLQAFKSLDSLRDAGKFRPWLYRIAVNRVNDFLRKKRFLAFFGVSTGSDDFEDGTGPEMSDTRTHQDPEALDGLIKQEFWTHVKWLSERLSRWEREVFFLRFLDQLTIGEIAQALNKSESTVKTLLHRALKKFRQDAVLLEILQGEQP